MAMGLVVLTLGGFALVASFVSKPVALNPSQSPSPSPPIKLGLSPLPTVTPSTSTRPISAEKQMYNDLKDALVLLDQLRDAATAWDWGTAQYLFNEFQLKTQRLPAPQLNHPDLSPVLQDFFTLYRVELARALNEQNLDNTRINLNQLFAIVSEQRTRLGTRGVPLELNRIHFLVREVELWSQLNNGTLLQERLKALRETWQELRPVIAARRNGRETANHFDSLIAQLNAATSAQELATLVAQCHKELEQIDGLFNRTPQPTSPTASPSKTADEE
jgi:hypothetical protein